MLKVYWATEIRSFLNHIIRSDIADFTSKEVSYDVSSIKKKFLSKIIRWRIWDILGIFKIIDVDSKNCDVYASFNRFLKCDKPYVIYLESPVALYHYSLKRIFYPLGRKKYNNAINDKNLKHIICMSNACMETFEAINGKITSDIKLSVIYPYVPSNVNITVDKIKSKSKRREIELLFIAQGHRFISKGGIEVIEAFKTLKQELKNIHLTIITKISDVNKSIISNIKATKDITLYDFTFSYCELEKIYANTNILIHPSSDDSIPLTILEAMKGGCAIITTNLYAIPEMVKNGLNGFLIEPKYKFYTEKNVPNPKIWNNRKKTLYSTHLSERLINELATMIKILYNNRELLEKMSINSLNLSEDNDFGERHILKQWENLLNDLIC